VIASPKMLGMTVLPSPTMTTTTTMKKTTTTTTTILRMRQAFGTLLDQSTGKNIDGEMSNTIYASIKQLQDLTRGQNFDDVAEKAARIVQSAKHATQSKTTLQARQSQSRTMLQPRQGPEANKQGKPRKLRMVGAVMARNGGTQPRKRQPQKAKCSFCQSTKCGNITSCKELKKLGYRIKRSALSDFLTNDLALKNARHDATKLQGLVTAENPILETLPLTTKWLVLHCLYNRNAMATSSATTEAQAVVEITCYGGLGTVVEGLAAGAANFDHVIAEFSTVRNWIASNAKKGCGKTATRLITSSDWKSDYLFCI
jgi:hypothetical protein